MCYTLFASFLDVQRIRHIPRIANTPSPRLSPHTQTNTPLFAQAGENNDTDADRAPAACSVNATDDQLRPVPDDAAERTETTWDLDGEPDTGEASGWRWDAEDAMWQPGSGDWWAETERRLQVLWERETALRDREGALAADRSALDRRETALRAEETAVRGALDRQTARFREEHAATARDLEAERTRLAEWARVLAERAAEDATSRDQRQKTVDNRATERERSLAERERVVAEREHVVAERERILSDREEALTESQTRWAIREYNLQQRKEHTIFTKDKHQASDRKTPDWEGGGRGGGAG